MLYTYTYTYSAAHGTHARGDSSVTRLDECSPEEGKGRGCRSKRRERRFYELTKRSRARACFSFLSRGLYCIYYSPAFYRRMTT